MFPKHNDLLIFHFLLFLTLILLIIILMPFTLILIILSIIVILPLIIFLLDRLIGRLPRFSNSNRGWLRHLHMLWYLCLLLPLYSNLIISKLRMWLWVDRISLMWIILCFYAHLLVVQLRWGCWVDAWLHVHLRRTSHVHAHWLHSRIKRWITSHKI